MNSCTRAHTYQATETKLWEREGQTWPDTSKPPDSQTSTPKELVLEDDGLCLSVFTPDGPLNTIDPEKACRDGGMFVQLPECASALATSGLAATTLARITGHSDPGFTYRVYARDGRDEATLVADVLQRAASAGFGA